MEYIGVPLDTLESDVMQRRPIEYCRIQLQCEELEFHDSADLQILENYTAAVQYFWNSMEYIGVQLNTAGYSSSVRNWSSMIFALSVDSGYSADSAHSADPGDSADYTAPVAYSGVPWNTLESN